jgi:hypothetical protein
LTYAKRNRTSAKDIGYALYLYFLGLCYRNTSKALPDLSEEGVMYLRLEMGSIHNKPERIYLSKEGKYLNL